MVITNTKTQEDGFRDYLQKLKNKVQRAKRTEKDTVLIGTDGVEKVIIYRYQNSENVKVFSHLDSKLFAKALLEYLKENAFEVEDYMVPLSLYNQVGISYFELKD